ncbi:hypothetical protein ACHHYP_15041 [Achlya hypogyna]|uniref:Uncharacterized protein n=1 Tax=Achlya hypogyna TaxID=1202772 RepID=A0A1V9YBU3_ACHHY|nr:hypothetical protein ACHHYP_15041 [Achlya hypogyna]
MARRPLNHVLQTPLYTAEYVHVHSRQEAIVAAENAWTALLEGHRRLYFDAMAPLTQYSPEDMRPRYYSPAQLEHAAAVIEAKTEHVMALQRQLLIDWHCGATRFQAAWRGFATRRRTCRRRFELKIQRVERLYFVAFHRRRLAIARHARRVQKAVKHIKFLVMRAHTSARVVQRSVRLYLFKCERWRAAARLVRWYRRASRLAKLRSRLGRIHRFVRWKRRETQLTELARVAVDARRRHMEFKQAAYMALQPDHVIVHRLVMARKQDVYRALHPELRSRPVVHSSAALQAAPLRIPMASKAMLAKAAIARAKMR